MADQPNAELLAVSRDRDELLAEVRYVRDGREHERARAETAERETERLREGVLVLADNAERHGRRLLAAELRALAASRESQPEESPNSKVDSNE